MDPYTASGFVIVGSIGIAFGDRYGFVSALGVGVLALISHFFH